MRWLALDIGGANIKVADGERYAASYVFPLWREHLRLGAQLEQVIARAPAADQLAITMTGELADCFRDQHQGVVSILNSVEQVAGRRRVLVYLTTGELVDLNTARERPSLAASANWHALARFAARFVPQDPGLLIDIGSTTCDLIPIAGGSVQAQGTNDLERLLSGELVYTGLERSPLCAIVSQVPYRGKSVPVAQELFATALDVYLLCGDIPEDSTNTSTADGRPATKSAAVDRLRRLICAHPAQFDERDAREMAEAIARAQLELLLTAGRKVLAQVGTLRSVVLTGHGEFLARRLLDRLEVVPQCISLSDQLTPGVSRCAPAHALAVLAREWHR